MPEEPPDPATSKQDAPDQDTPDHTPRPRSIDLQRDRALTVHWHDGATSVYPVALLRRMSPSAESKALREEMARNPLTVLPAGFGSQPTGPLRVEDAQLVGNYAIQLRFSDGHHTGIFSWTYLKSLDAEATKRAD